jgi:hypothetical protein
LTTRLALVGALLLSGLSATRVNAAMVVPDVFALVAAMQRAELRDFAEYRSVRVHFIHPHASATLIFDYDLDKTRAVIEEQGIHFTMYMVGSTVYIQDRSGAWTKIDTLRLAAHAPKPAPKPATSPTPSGWDQMQFLPDRRVNGALMRVSRFVGPVKAIDPMVSSKKTVRVTCFYERQSRWLRSCYAGNSLFMTMDHYDDPSNDFAIPAAVLRAPLVTPWWERAR